MTQARSASTVIGYAAVVEKVSVKGKVCEGEENKYVCGAERQTVTRDVFGRERRVEKKSVSLPSAADQSMGCVDGVGMSNTEPNPLAKDLKALSAQASQCEISVVGLKHSLCFLPAWSEDVTNGSSQHLVGLDVVNMTEASSS